jgi:hypothetical protein
VLFFSTMSAAQLPFRDRSSAKGFILYVFVAICFNVRIIDCQKSPAQVSIKRISHEVFLDWLIQTNSPTAQASNINEQCIRHTRQYLTALGHRQSWAVKSKFVHIFIASMMTSSLADG